VVVKKIILFVVLVFGFNGAVCQEKEDWYDFYGLRQKIGYGLLFVAEKFCHVKPDQKTIERLRSRIALLEDLNRESAEKTRVLSEQLFQQQQLNLKKNKIKDKHRVLHLSEKYTHQRILPGVSSLDTVKEELENSESDHEN